MKKYTLKAFGRYEPRYGRGPSKIYGVPGPGLSTGGHRLFFSQKKGGDEFFSAKKKGATSFFQRKKGGDEFFSMKKRGKGGAEFFTQGEIPKTQPGYPVNFGQFLISNDVKYQNRCSL